MRMTKADAQQRAGPLVRDGPRERLQGRRQNASFRLDPTAVRDGMAAFHQDIRFARTHDALNIAYAVSGRGYPLVRTATWMSNVERDWRTGILGPWFRELSGNYTLV